jgi:cell division inhibitor SepF
MESIMNVLDSLKDFFMPADDNEPEAPNMTAPEEEPAAATASSSYSNAGYTRTSSYDDRKNNERYATIKATAQFQVVLVKATAYTSDSKKVADYLMQNKTVVLNLEGIEEPDKRRIIDFVVGAAYAMHGRIKPIANQTFLIIPQNVGFDGDSFVGELQGSGLV